MARGRPKKPTALHKFEGTLNVTRHADREDEQIVTGKPRKPAILKGEAAKEWTRIVGKSPEGVYGEQDVSTLIAHCRNVETMMKAMSDEDWELAHRCMDKHVKFCGKLGLGPIERTRLHIDPNAKKKDDFEQWENKVVG